jgi:hypothetical protein
MATMAPERSAMTARSGSHLARAMNGLRLSVTYRKQTTIDEGQRCRDESLETQLLMEREANKAAVLRCLVLAREGRPLTTPKRTPAGRPSHARVYEFMPEVKQSWLVAYLSPLFERP